MVAFAEVSDLEARWRPLVGPESTTAGVLLGDASAMIRAECPDIDARLEAVPPLVDEGIPRMVACAMVKRAMLASGLEGVSSGMDVAGPFTQQRSFANPMGNLYLTKAERKLLGCSQQKAFTVDMGPTETPGGGLPLNWWELNL